MYRQYLNQLLWIVTLLACTASAHAHQVTFNFSNPSSLTAMGLAVPTSTVKTTISSPITIDDVTITPSTTVPPQVTYYKNAYNLYIVKNAHVTLSVPQGKTITGVEFTSLNSAISLSTSAGALSGLKWTGDASSIKFTGTASNTIYTVTVTIDEALPPIPTVTGIAQLKSVEPGTTVRLFIPDENNCRVTYVSEDDSEVFLRDNTGAIMLDNVNANPRFKSSQHIAGWITGRFENRNGLPKLVATKETNTTQLVIADRVSEPLLQPAAISANQFSNNAANWVILSNLRVSENKATSAGEEFTINNLYGLGDNEHYSTPYNGSVVDISGIAIPTTNGNIIAPVNVDFYPPIIYVLNEDSAYTAPSHDINNTAIRINRQMVANRWQTYSVPFECINLGFEYMEPVGLENGVLTFVPCAVNKSVAHMPFLVKPGSNPFSIMRSPLDLKAGSPITSTGMTGVYRSTFMDNNMVTVLGRTKWHNVLTKVPMSQVPSTHAYFDGVTMLNVNGTMIYFLGDVNADGGVDVADVNSIINIIMGLDPAKKYNYRDDINEDDITDVIDINTLINLIMGHDSGIDITIY